MAKSSSRGAAETAPEPAEEEQPSTPASTADTAPAPVDPPPAAARPVKARVPYPHSALVLPGGGATPAGGGQRGDLVITREWTDVPADQADRLKTTATKARIKLQLAVPDNNGAGE